MAGRESRPEPVLRCRPMDAPPSRLLQSRRSEVSPRAAAVVLAAAGLVFGAVFFGGASGDGSVPWVGGAAVVVAAVVVAAWCLGFTPLPRLALEDRVAVAGLTGLVIWIGISIAWSVAGDLSWSELNKGIAYLAALAIGVGLCLLGTSTTRVLAGLLATVLGLALGWALIGRAIPALAPQDALSVARLHSPIGYWNGLALLADAALALGAWIAAAWWPRAAGRGLGGALVYLAVLAGLLTTSRAGVLGGVLALGLWLWLGERRVESASAAVVAGVPAAAVAAWTFTRPALVEVGHAHAARVHDGAIFAAFALAGLAVAVVAVVFVPRVVGGRERAVGRRLAATAAIAAVAGAVAVPLAVGNPVSQVTRGLSRSECTNTAGHLGCVNNNRLRWWREAGRIFVAHPLEGTGAGTFRVARKRYRKSGDPVTEPHSVPMQVLAETGVVGGLLLVLFVAGAGAGIARSVRTLEVPERPAAVALAAFPAVYGLHGLVDYDADFLALTVPLLIVVGALLGAGRPLARSRAGVVPALAAVAVAATAVVSLALPWLSQRRVDSSFVASGAHRFQQAVDDANGARSLDPLSPDPLYALGYAYESAGNLVAARGAFTRATKLQPRNAETWFQLGLFEFTQTHDMCAAYQALNHSYTLDPKSTFWAPGKELDQARDAVNHGACE